MTNWKETVKTMNARIKGVESSIGSRGEEEFVIGLNQVRERLRGNREVRGGSGEYREFESKGSERCEVWGGKGR